MRVTEVVDEILSAELTYEELCDLTEKLLRLAEMMSRLPRGAPSRIKDITSMRLYASLLLNLLYFKLTGSPINLELIGKLKEAIEAIGGVSQ